MHTLYVHLKSRQTPMGLESATAAVAYSCHAKMAGCFCPLWTTHGVPKAACSSSNTVVKSQLTSAIRRIGSTAKEVQDVVTSSKGSFSGPERRDISEPLLSKATEGALRAHSGAPGDTLGKLRTETACGLPHASPSLKNLRDQGGLKHMETYPETVQRLLI